MENSSYRSAILLQVHQVIYLESDNPPPLNTHPEPTLRDIAGRDSSSNSIASSSRSGLRQVAMDKLAEGMQERTRVRNEIVKLLNENIKDSAATDAKLASFAKEKGQRFLKDSQSKCREWLEKVHQQERVEGQTSKDIKVINKLRPRASKTRLVRRCRLRSQSHRRG